MGMNVRAAKLRGMTKGEKSVKESNPTPKATKGVKYTGPAKKGGKK